MQNGKKHPGVFRERRVGYGVTKHQVVTFRASPAGIDWYAEQSKGKFWVTDFLGSLNYLEEQLREQARALPGGLPDVPMPWFQLLKREYQSRDWYIGRLLQRIDMVRDEIGGGDPMRLAGEAFKLGIIKKEYELKFKAEALYSVLQDLEDRMIEGGQRGTDTKSKKRAVWTGIVDKFLDSQQIGSIENKSEAARRCLALWPSGVPKVGERSIVEYIGNTGHPSKAT